MVVVALAVGPSGSRLVLLVCHASRRSRNACQQVRVWTGPTVTLTCCIARAPQPASCSFTTDCTGGNWEEEYPGDSVTCFRIKVKDGHNLDGFALV